MKTKKLKIYRDFAEVEKGDFLAVKWKRDSYINNKRTRFAVYQVYENKKRTEEIILQRKNNVYFNYKLFCNPALGISNAEEVLLIKEN